MQINGSVNITCNKLLLQNMNGDQSWHHDDDDYTEPVEIIAVVTESLTGILLFEVFQEESKLQIMLEELSAMQSGLEMMAKYHVLKEI